MKQTAVEQAKELVEHYAETIEPIEFGIILERNWISAKQCALIAVDLAIQYNDFHIEFLQEVKQEIENF
jgi:hypothetical protein